MFELSQSLRFPMVLIQRFLAAIDVVRAVVAGTILSIVAPTGAIQVGSVSVGKSVRS